MANQGMGAGLGLNEGAGSSAAAASAAGEADPGGGVRKMSEGMKSAMSSANAGVAVRPELPEGWLGADVKAGLRSDGRPAGAAGGLVDPEMNMADPQEEPEPAPEGEMVETEEGPEVDVRREVIKSLLGTLFVVLFWVCLVVLMMALSADFTAPVCEEDATTTTTLAALETLNGTQSSAVVVEEIEPCEPCGGGLFLPFFGDYELSMNRWLRAPFYFIGLMWTFLGIGIVCDQFMGAIEVITSAEKETWLEVRPGTMHKFRSKAWNQTVANLTLMALGSSAPEILLSVIEIMSNDYFAGPLGPSTIVGSAAFNLLCITGVCVSAIPAPEMRKIACTDVFVVTASSSVFAYIWMLIMLQFMTPDLVTVMEGLITWCMFPVLCITAFAADKGWLAPVFKICKKREKAAASPGMDRSGTWIDKETTSIEAKYGKELPEETMKKLLKQRDAQNKPQAAGKAAIRKNIMCKVSGGGQKTGAQSTASGGEILYGFEQRNHMVLECAGTVNVKVISNRPSGFGVQMRYCTKEGTAKEGVRYRHSEGIVKFLPYQVERAIQVDMIDDEEWQPEESFTVVLSDFQVVEGMKRSPRGQKATRAGRQPTGATVGSTMSEFPEPRLAIDTTAITVLNDDMPGTLSFDDNETKTRQGCAMTLGVIRTHGACGHIDVRYRTVEGTAVAGRDFQHVDGVLRFAENQTHKMIEVKICTSGDRFIGDRRFQVMLSDGSPGVKFDDRTPGDYSTVCDVLIAGRKPPICGRIFRSFCNGLRMEYFTEWLDQFTGALYCNGSPEEQAKCGWKEWSVHILSLTWKVLFAFVPPPNMLGGWACFCGALGAIGMVTAVVGDLAAFLGCCIGLPGDITAITLVALGTSLPDTFASKVAAQQDDTADNSVGNVTGSNSVNVFLGLGMPWTIAAYYWTDQGRTEEWDNHMHNGKRYATEWGSTYPEGGFLMPAGSLGFSVSVFTACALACLVLLFIRRTLYGGELGGPKFAQQRDSGLMYMLWLVYVVASSVQSLTSSN
jgi:solute carrier family 8 (sodium/calcium exchanger)